jgi:DNA-binding SARP family transcriptional activator
MDLLRITLFGRFDVRVGQKPLAGLEAAKVQELFCYLLLNRDRPHPREALAHILWDANSTNQPGRCLRKTLWQLRAALDAQTEPLSDLVLLVEPNWIQFSPGVDLWLDVAVFEQAYQRVHGLQGREIDENKVQMLQKAANLYRGGLQESWYQDWYLLERERYQHMYLSMLDKLMDHCEEHKAYEDGLAYGTLILHIECARERTHRRLMRLHHLAGDRTAALRQYQNCMISLQEELGVKPARRTEKLYKQICSDQLARPGQMVDVREGVDRAPTGPFFKVLNRLKQLHTALAQVQLEIQQDIYDVEHTLRGQD